MTILIYNILTWKSLDKAGIAGWRILRMNVDHRIFIQESVLNHMWVIDSKKIILQKNIVLSQVFSWRYLLSSCVVVLLLVIILIVVLVHRSIKSPIFKKVLWWSWLNFIFDFKMLIYFFALVYGPHWDKTVTYYRSLDIKFRSFEWNVILLLIWLALSVCSLVNVKFFVFLIISFWSC